MTRAATSALFTARTVPGASGPSGTASSCAVVTAVVTTVCVTFAARLASPPQAPSAIASKIKVSRNQRALRSRSNA